jgi:hypothetical protein
MTFSLPDESGVGMPLANALALSPKLRVVRTQLPMVWNPALLVISNNPSLEKVELWNGFQDLGGAIAMVGLFLTDARGNKRLADLIGAGTSVRFHCVFGILKLMYSLCLADVSFLRVHTLWKTIQISFLCHVSRRLPHCPTQTRNSLV